VSTKNLAGGHIQVLNVAWIKWINCHLVDRDEDSVPECILDTKNWLHCNRDLDNHNDSEDNWETDNQYVIIIDDSVKDS
jgi:hypothetical protein